MIPALAVVAAQSPAAGVEVDAHTMVILTIYIAPDKTGDKQ